MSAHPTQFGAKDAAIFIPIAGPTLAIAWEVGSFFPIGGGAFGLFSIAEHLTFALQALPFAVAFFTAFASTAFFQQFLKLGTDSRRFNYLMAVGIVLLNAIAWALLAHFRQFHSISEWLLAPGLAFFCAFLIVRPSQIFVAFALGVYTLVFAYILGIDSTVNAMNDEHRIQTISTNNGELHVVVLRASSIGIVYYDPTALTFGFLKMDSLKEMRWQFNRSPRP